MLTSLLHHSTVAPLLDNDARVMDHYGMEVGGVMNGHVTCAFVPIGILVWQMPKRLRLHHQSHCRHISKDATLPKKTWTSALHTGGKIFQKRMTQRAVNEMFVVNRIMYPFLHVSGYTNIAIQRERFHMATMMSATLRDCERQVIRNINWNIACSSKVSSPYTGLPAL